MRVGISTSVIQRGKTGVAQYVFALLRALLENPSRPELVLFVLAQDLPLFSFAHDNVEFVTVGEEHRPPVKNILWHQAQLPRLVRRCRLDVLHVPSYRRLLWRKPCRLVGTIHDLAPFRVAHKYDWTRMFYGRVIARRLARRQDAIIAISANTRNDIVRFFGLAPDRIHVIHNGIDHQRFCPGSTVDAVALVQQKYQLAQPYFLYVARLEHPGKNHVRLISAFEEFKAATHSNWQLVFGGSDWHGAEAIHAAISQSPFAADIRCLGFVPDNDLPGLYRAASVFVYPSLYEGFGFPPLEAMACGCPVMSSTCGSLGEVVGEAAAVVNPEDIHSIAKQLYILATDQACPNRLRAAGLARGAKFDWQQTASRTVQVFRGATDAPGS